MSQKAPGIDFHKFFQTLPRQKGGMVSFPLTNQPLQGMCWLGATEALPSNEDVLRDFLKLPEEELRVFEDNSELEHVVRKHAESAYPDEDEDSPLGITSVQQWEIGIGKNVGGSFRYLLRSEDGAMLFTSRISESGFRRLMESVSMLYAAANILPKENGLADCAGMKETPVQLWRFALLADNSVKKLRNRTACFLSLLRNPHSLWSVCVQVEESMVHAAVVSLPMLEMQVADNSKLVLYGSKKLSIEALLHFRIHVNLFWKE